MFTVESMLTGLDRTLADCQESLQQLQQQREATINEQTFASNTRLSNLKAHLPSILGSEVAFSAHTNDLPHPQADIAKQSWHASSQARSFGTLVREIDHLVKQFHTDQKPQSISAMRPLFTQLEELPFKEARELFKSEIDAQITPARQVAADELKGFLGDWPTKAPQTIDFVAAVEKLMLLEPFDKPTMTAFDVLAEPIDLRVKFNFESGQKTQRYDKPEWLFYFFQKTLDPHTQWLKNTVQPLCPLGKFALDELISSILPSFFRSAGLYLENSLSDPELLGAFLQESFKFDADLRDKYFYSYAPNWPGLTTTLLLNKENAMSQWLEYEKSSTTATYSALVEATNAWDVDYDSTDTRITSRATVLTLGVCALFDSITELYSHLNFAQLQLRFFELQISLVDRYLATLKRHKNHPQADLDDYGKVLGSVGYFIDFLQHRNMHLTFIDLKEKLATENGLLDEIIQNLDKFRKSCLEETNSMIAKALKGLFRDYPSVIGTEPLERRLKVFQAICNPVDYSSIVYRLSNSLAKYFWTNVVHAGSFTSSQGASLGQDLESIWSSLGLLETKEYLRVKAAAHFFQIGETAGLTTEEITGLQRRKRE